MIFLEYLLWHKYREPLKNKVKRWVFGDNNVVPESITE